MSNKSEKLAQKYIEFTMGKEFTKAITDHACDAGLVEFNVGPNGREINMEQMELVLEIIKPAVLKTREFLSQLEWDDGQDKPRIFMPN